MLTLLILSGVYQLYRRHTGRQISLKPIPVLAKKLIMRPFLGSISR